MEYEYALERKEPYIVKTELTKNQIINSKRSMYLLNIA